MRTLLLKNERSQLIKGHAGNLELAVYQPEADIKGLAIICHPHPLYGGTLSNKVVATLAKTYHALQFITIRFNFRGVGQSDGHYSDGVGELDDLLSVIAFAKDTLPQAPLHLAGFSFGAYIAMKAASIEHLTQLVTIAPPVVNFPMQDEHPNCPWILVQGDQDEIVSAEAVYAFAESRQHLPQILRFPDATHFFHGHLTELQTRLHETILVL